MARDLAPGGARSTARCKRGPEPARFLLVTEPAGFEEFVRAVAQPAQTLTIPAPPSEPPDLQRLIETAARYGIEIIGPPGIPD
jgi:hypothetical protein